MMQGTPSSWKLLLASGFKKEMNFKALCGGEPLTKQLASELTSNVEELWNMYGPTEATVWASCQKIEKDTDKILIGKPLANYEFYILDENKGKLLSEKKEHFL